MKTQVVNITNDALAIVAFDYFLLHDKKKANHNKVNNTNYKIQRQETNILINFEKYNNEENYYQFYSFNNIAIRIEKEKNRNYTYLNINENLDFILTFGKNGFNALLKSESNILFIIKFFPNENIVKIYNNDNEFSYKIIK